jgi:hypothetical protein
MSTVTIDPDGDYFYRDLKVAVYYNLFVGIAYGESPPFCCYSVLIRLVAGVSITLYAVSVHILV